MGTEPVGLGGVVFFAAIALIGVLLQMAEGPSGGLSAKIEALQADFDKYVRPRHITDGQRDAIVSFLLERKPPETVHILHFFPDDEALSYAAQINHALIKADWKTTSYAGVPPNLPTTDRTIFKTGIRFFVEYTPLHRENSRALRLLEDAFREAGVQSSGMSSWTNPDGNEMKLYLCVGPRPRK